MSSASIGQPRAPAAEFATRNVFEAEPAGAEKNSEVRETLRELISFFGAPAIARALDDLGLIANPDSANAAEQIQQALRAYSCLILESPRRRMTAQLVGKLVGMEMTTGQRIRLQDIATAEGISKQAVSKHLATYAQRLGLARPDSTEAARNAHRLSNRRNYASPAA